MNNARRREIKKHVRYWSVEGPDVLQVVLTNLDRFSELTGGYDHVEVRIGAEIAHGEHVGVKKSGCHGFCEMGPLVRIEPYNYLYLKVKLEDCEEIFEKTVLHGEPVTRLMYKQDNEVYQTQEEIPFYAKQTRLVLKNCGHIDAEHIEDALAVRCI